jgi:hypothetical protein
MSRECTNFSLVLFVNSWQKFFFSKIAGQSQSQSQSKRQKAKGKKIKSEAKKMLGHWDSWDSAT